MFSRPGHQVSRRAGQAQAGGGHPGSRVTDFRVSTCPLPPAQPDSGPLACGRKCRPEPGRQRRKRLKDFGSSIRCAVLAGVHCVRRRDPSGPAPPPIRWRRPRLLGRRLRMSSLILGSRQASYAPAESIDTQLAARIRQDIIVESCSEGEWLPEAQPCKTLDASRTPIRLALRLFERQGATSRGEGCGYMVQAPAALDIGQDT